MPATAPLIPVVVGLLMLAAWLGSLPCAACAAAARAEADRRDAEHAAASRRAVQAARHRRRHRCAGRPSAN